MKITSVLGSPRKKGNTNRVLQWVEVELQKQGHETERINISDHKVRGCKGCFTCKKSTDKPGCPQKDDVMDIFDRLMASDRILYGSPNYFWGMTSQMKTLIDRHCSLVTGYGTPQWHSLLAGKGIGLVITCEDAAENNVYLIEEMFGRFANYLKCDHLGSLVVPLASKPEAMGEEIRQRSLAFAHQIGVTP
jgi:multimeric flavodoxin WrbA